jgi:parallel beta-helix repeat protein
MKIKISVIAIILLLALNLTGQFIIQETASIDSLTLQKIREACNNNYYPNSLYADPLVNWAFTIFSDEDGDSIIGDEILREDCPISIRETSENAFRGAFPDIPGDDLYDQEGYIEYANTYIQDTLNVQAFIDWCSDSTIGQGTRGHWLAFEMNNLARTADWLFYAPDSIISQADHANMLAKVDSLVTYVADLFDDLPYYPPNTTDVWGDPSGTIYPRSFLFQLRPRHLAGLGYSALILMEDSTFMAIGNNSTRIPAALNLVDDDFLTTNYFGETGILDMNGQTSGAYCEGLGYGTVTYYDLVMFFTAYNRLSNGADNYFNNEHVKGVMTHTANMLTPEIGPLHYDECWRHLQKVLLCGTAEFFYQNTNDTNARNLVGWYINSNKNGIYWPLEFKDINMTSYYNVIPCYNPDSTIKIDDTFSSPSSYENGFYSDEEFAILRDSINTVSDLKNDPAIYVVYENSMGGHEQADQSSFTLYYREEEVLITPGYRPYVDSLSIAVGRDWTVSPYSHNMIIVSPDSTAEYNELYNDFWNYATPPSYTFEDWEPKRSPDYDNHINPTCPSPAYKDFGFSFQDIDHLKVELNYYDSVDVARNFYRIGSHFIIYDVIETIDEAQRTYWNSLHFAPNLDSYTDTNDVFSIRKNSARLHGVIGSNSNNSFYVFDEYNPYNLVNGSTATSGTSSIYHKRGRRSTTAVDPAFLTLLIPSESSFNPIDSDVESGSNYYAVRYDLDSSDDYYSFTGVKRNTVNSITYTETPQVIVETNAEFYLIQANDDFDDFKKIVLNGGNELEVQLNTIVFDSDVVFEEILADYEDGLHVVFKTDASSYPKYKILRCAIDPADFYSSTEYGSQQTTRGTIQDNIQKLAYDNDYFYVNYTYNNLINEGVMSDDLVLYAGEYSPLLFTMYGYPSKLRFDGEVELSGVYTIADTIELVFEAGANPTLSGTAKFDIYGTVTAIGTSSDKILFTTDSDWDGFYIRDDAESEFDYCEFENSDYPIRCLGSIDIQNSEITNCSYGLYLQDCDSYLVQNNEFSNCDSYGLLVSNINPIFHASQAIWNNQLHDNDYGIYLFNTNVEIDSNFVYENNDYGIFASSGSSSLIENSCIQETGDISDNPEIYLVDESYLILDYKDNDIIFDEGYSVYNADKKVTAYYCRDNYWGTTTQNDICDSFYPSTWNVYYDPWLTSAATGFNSRSESLFEMGLAAEEAGLLQVARGLYLQCIDECEFEIDKIWSASRLINCVDLNNNFSYYDIQSIYETITLDTLNPVLSSLAQKLAINCDRKNADFQAAILKYENILTDSISYLDSILVQLNIVHTYFEAESAQGRAELTFSNKKYSIKDHKHARQKEVSLLELIREETLGEGNNTPIIDKVVLYNNYPNPFNPETKISFSIPKQSKVKLFVFNIKGQKVKTLVNDDLEKGLHDIVWKSKDDSGKSVASGVYFYSLEVNNRTKGLKKMLLLK